MSTGRLNGHLRGRYDALSLWHPDRQTRQLEGPSVRLLPDMQEVRQLGDVHGGGVNLRSSITNDDRRNKKCQLN